MADRKVYVPMSYDQAADYLEDKVKDIRVFNDGAVMMYAEILKLHERIDEIENQAQEMMSPDAMMDMATKFLGGGLTA